MSHALRRFVIGTLQVLAAAPVLAVQPIQVTETFDFTVLAPNTSAVCGFDVYRRIAGVFTVTGIVHDGTVVKEIDGAHRATVTWSAPSQGTSYSSPFNAPGTYLYPEGGTIGAPALLYILGLAEKVPGTPATAGQRVYEGVVIDLTPEGIPIVVTEAEPVRSVGNIGATIEDRCAALTAE